jgi:N-acetylmuramoyl-L-alanine amidase
MGMVLAAERNRLYRVFHHRVEVVSGAVPFLELGKLVFSFSFEPVVDVVQNRSIGSGPMCQRVFFLPLTEIASQECKDMLAAIERSTKTPYRVSFDSVEKPVPGLRFTVVYDHEKVGVTYAIMESTGEQKRLIVTFYDKNLVRKIRDTQSAVLRTVYHGSKRGVIVDCGHGGQDCGAQGCFSLSEKDLNLEIGTYVAGLLKHKGFDVFLTRSADKLVALDDRTLITDRNKYAAAFVSIHLNAAPNIHASGIETFFFDASKYCVRNDKPSCLVRALLADRCAKSELLAKSIHTSVLRVARSKNYIVLDRAVKQSFLQVLVGSCVPAALIELGFLTNQQEALLLKDTGYKMLLAAGICDGIVRYFEQML